MVRLLLKAAILLGACAIARSTGLAPDAPAPMCMGTRPTGAPAVILEAGAGNGVEAWAKVQPAIAEFARVCAYDRPGLRRYWKDDEPPAAPTPEAVLDTLERALSTAGERSPYVLVGHSYGGLIVRLYASRFPERVKGVVLVDSSHEDQMRRLGEPAPPLPGPGTVINVPEVIDLVAMNGALNAHTWRADIPLLVLTRGSAREIKSSNAPDAASLARYEIWLDLQRELATRSPRAEHIIAKQSGHFIQNDEPQLVIAGVRRILDTQ